MSIKTSILERTAVYRAWQAPFVEQKFAPILAKNDFRQIGRVLDVACGPGTNTGHFAHVEYLGIDVNEEYVRDAKKKWGRDFVAVDARDLDRVCKQGFDFILINSFLHHLNNKDVSDVLESLHAKLTSDGYIHILELVLPEPPSIARLLARWDRGEFARPLNEWHSLLSQSFAPVLFEPYDVGAAGIPLWKMVYFKGKRKA
jgi:SAM-dependent methyltransferase